MARKQKLKRNLRWELPISYSSKKSVDMVNPTDEMRDFEDDIASYFKNVHNTPSMRVFNIYLGYSF